MHAASVVTALQNRIPNMQIDGIGGPGMAAAGVNIIEPLDQLAAMGTIEAVGSLPHHLRLFSRLRGDLRAGRWDLALLVDYPGLHLRVAAAAAAASVPVLYYIAPQLWAWGAWRVRRFKESISAAAVILPFEEQFFREHGVRAEFVGHPLLDRESGPSREAAREELGVGAVNPALGLFPGARRSEVERHWPVLRDAARQLTGRVGDLDVILAAVPGLRYPRSDEVTVALGRPRHVMAAADVVLCKSGTTTLEAALAETPMVIAYRMNPITHAVARSMVRVRHIGLVNLMGFGEVAPELIQGEATPEALAEAVYPLLERDGPAAKAQRRALRRVRQILGEAGAADRVAAMAQDLVG